MANEVYQWLKVVASNGATAVDFNFTVGEHYLLVVEAPFTMPSYLEGATAVAIRAMDLTLDVTRVQAVGQTMEIEFTKTTNVLMAGVGLWQIIKVVGTVLVLTGFAFTLYVLGRAEVTTSAVSGAVSGVSNIVQATGAGAKQVADAGGGFLIIGGILLAIVIIAT